MNNPTRRKKHRHRKRIFVQWQSDEASGSGFTRDISLEGVGIVTDRVVAPGTDVSMRFTAGEKDLTAQGTIRWTCQIPGTSVTDISWAMGVEIFDYSNEFGRFIRHLTPSDSQDISLCRARDIGVKNFAECLVDFYPLNCRFATNCGNGRLCKHPNRKDIVQRTVNDETHKSK